jgi:hypothetical protein
MFTSDNIDSINSNVRQNSSWTLAATKSFTVRKAKTALAQLSNNQPRAVVIINSTPQHAAHCAMQNSLSTTARSTKEE